MQIVGNSDDSAALTAISSTRSVSNRARSAVHCFSVFPRFSMQYKCKKLSVNCFFLSTATLSLSLAQHAMQMSKALKAAILRSALLSHFCFAPLFTLDNNNICTRCKCQCTHTNMRKLNAPTSKYTHSQSHSQSHSH